VGQAADGDLWLHVPIPKVIPALNQRSGSANKSALNQRSGSANKNALK
jgi:hypothetical protein